MTKQNLSGCLSDKQIYVLNTKFTELPFELGCVLDEVFFKILASFNDQEFCDHADTPQDTSGEDVFVCINDGECHFVNKAQLVKDLETLTMAQYDPATHTITYIKEDGTSDVLALNVGIATIDPLTCELVYTDEKGVETRTAIPQPSLVLDSVASELVWTDAKGVETRIPLGGSCLTSPNGTHTACVEDDGCLVVSALIKTTPLTNTTAEGYLGYDIDGGIKPMALPDTIDIKCVTLCDEGNDNKPYLLEVTNNITTGVKTTATFELDGVTRYTVITAGAYKPVQCSLTEIYVTAGGVDQSYFEEYWETNATDPGNVSIELAFTEVDECGVIQHSVQPFDFAPPSGYPNAGATTYDPVTPGLAHQAVNYGFICVPPGESKEIFMDSGGLSSSALYLGGCDGKLQLKVNEVGTGNVSAGILTPGFYKFRLYCHDDGTNGKASIRWRDADGTGSVVRIPLSNIYSVKPTANKVMAWLEKGSEIATTLDGTTYDLVNGTDKVFLCDPLATEVSTGLSIAGLVIPTTKASATILGGERIVIDSTAANPTSSLTVPAGANGAFVQTLIKDEAERTHCVNYYVDGRTPTAANGFQAGHKEVLSLGCAAGNGSSSADSIEELINFILHAGEVTAGDVCLEVSYYTFP